MKINFIQKYGALWAKIVVMAIASLLLVLAIYFNYSFYPVPVGKVVSQTQQNTHAKDSKTVVQRLSIKIVNDAGKIDKKGSIIHVTNSFEKEKTYGEEYRKGDFLFVEKNKDGYVITGQKRDYIIALLGVLLVDLLFLIGKKQGILTILGVVLNGTLFAIAIRFLGSSDNFIWIVVALMILFTIGILVLVSGWNRETLATVLATLLTVTAVGCICFVVILMTPKIKYEFLDYLPEPYSLSQANGLLLSEILIGALGAIMDIAVTIVAATKELIAREPGIKRRDLMMSIGKISDDITGLMINVVFFTNIAVVLPVAVLGMKNDFSLWTVLENHGFFAFVRFLVAGLGIIAAIPLSAFIGEMFFKGRVKK